MVRIEGVLIESDVTSESETAYYENALPRDTRRRRKRSRSLGRYRSTAAVGSALSSPTEFTARIDDAEDDDSETTANICRMSRRKKLTVVTFCIANFFLGLFYSILAPFFPTEAAKKGVNGSLTGLVFGCFELVLVLVSPFYGSYLNQIGSKFMFVTGIFVCGVCSILFGFLDKIPGGIEYLILCFVVRIFEALGAAAYGTASFAIMAYNFPNHVATMFGTLEMFTGLGLMAGPPLGGVLFELGGFVLPFAILGSLVLLVGFISLFILPTQRVSQLPREGSVFSLLKIPLVIITGLCLVAGSGCMGYFDVTLSLFLSENFKLSPMMVGFVFLVEPVGYCIMSPIWGRIVDSKPHLGQPFVAGGYIITGLTYFFIGPAPFFNFQPNLVVVMICLILAGFGISTLTITFQIISEAVLAAGYSDNLATYGLIAGLVNSFFSVGAFIGPLGGGFLHDMFGFAKANVFIGVFTILTSLALIIYTLATRNRASQSEERRLLDQDEASSNQQSFSKSYDKNNLLITIETNVPD